VSEPTPSFDELLEFPAELVLRAVGNASEDLAARCAGAVVTLHPSGLLAVDEVPSSRGRFSSVRLKVQVESADQLRSLYAALKTVDGVRMVL
jgi:putative lipoic acid-binding regulatory protein